MEIKYLICAMLLAPLIFTFLALALPFAFLYFSFSKTLDFIECKNQPKKNEKNNSLHRHLIRGFTADNKKKL
jgi:hypothetical protein